MKYRAVLLSTLCAIFILTFFSGIIRHDVDEKKYLKLAAKKQFDCVGQIYRDTSATGSCVLISDRFVLSAAHIFIESDTRADTIEHDGQTIVASSSFHYRQADISNLYLVFKGQRVKVKTLWLHPHFLDSLTKRYCDIALIELEKPIKNIKPAKLNNVFNELNSNVVGVGFGVSGTADKPELVGIHNKKIAGENVVDSIGGQDYLGNKTVLVCDFDHPTREDCNKLGSPIPRPLEYIASAGDSGGGLFRKNNKQWELIGICSGSSFDLGQFMKTGYYGQTMRWTRVSVFTNWIEEQKRLAGNNN